MKMGEKQEMERNTTKENKEGGSDTVRFQFDLEREGKLDHQSASP